MLDKIKRDTAHDLDKVKDGDLDEVQARIARLINATKARVEKDLNALDQAHKDADQFATPIIDKINGSKFTVLILAGIFFGALSTGIMIGTYL